MTSKKSRHAEKGDRMTVWLLLSVLLPFLCVGKCFLSTVITYDGNSRTVSETLYSTILQHQLQSYQYFFSKFLFSIFYQNSLLAEIWLFTVLDWKILHCFVIAYLSLCLNIKCCGLTSAGS